MVKPLFRSADAKASAAKKAATPKYHVLSMYCHVCRAGRAITMMSKAFQLSSLMEIN